MEFSVIGPIIALVGLYYYLVKPKNLLYLYVFFVPFSSTAILNFPALTFGVQPFHFLGGLLLVSRVVRGRSLGMAGGNGYGYGYGYGNGGMGAPSMFVFIFIAILILSLVVAATNQRYSLTNLTQVALFSFSVLSVWVVADSIRDFQVFRQCVRVIIYSGAFVAGWGIVEYVSEATGAFPYPDWLFNTSGSESALNFAQVLIDESTRLSSVAIEPSFLARALIIFLAIATVLIGKRVNLDIRWLYPITAMIALTSVLSTSTTAYIGLALLTAYVLFRFPILFCVIGLVLSLTVLWFMIFPSEFVQVFYEQTFEKSATGSYHSRTQSIVNAMNAFTKAPLFGYGWGDKVSSDCHDLVFRLLSGTGLFGFAGFLALVSSIYWASLRHTQLIKQGALGYGPDGGLSQRANEALAMVQALRVALTIAIALDVVTGLSFVAGPLWLVMGLMAGASHALSPEQSRYPAGMGIEGLRA